MDWISIDDDKPKARQGHLISNDLLFACDDGRVYCGTYHTNGCFYGINIMAWTQKAIRDYNPNPTGIVKVLFWAELPKHPLIEKKKK